MFVENLPLVQVIQSHSLLEVQLGLEDLAHPKWTVNRTQSQNIVEYNKFTGWDAYL